MVVLEDRVTFYTWNTASYGIAIRQHSLIFGLGIGPGNPERNLTHEVVGGQGLHHRVQEVGLDVKSFGQSMDVKAKTVLPVLRPLAVKEDLDLGRVHERDL